jgi:hypothetical protein
MQLWARLGKDALDLPVHEKLGQCNEQCPHSHDQAPCSNYFWPVKFGSKVANKCYNQEIPFGGKNKEFLS